MIRMILINLCKSISLSFYPCICHKTLVRNVYAKMQAFIQCKWLCIYLIPSSILLQTICLFPTKKHLPEQGPKTLIILPQYKKTVENDDEEEKRKVSICPRKALCSSASPNPKGRNEWVQRHGRGTSSLSLLSSYPSTRYDPLSASSSHGSRQRGREDQHHSPPPRQVKSSDTSHAVTNLLSIPKLEFNRNIFVTLSITNSGEKKFS